MKLNSDSETLAANKVLILYVLDLVKKPISNDTLYTIVNTAENMNYFYFQQFLLDLKEAKYITTYENEVQEVIEITDEGKKTLDLTIDLNANGKLNIISKKYVKILGKYLCLNDNLVKYKALILIKEIFSEIGEELFIILAVFPIDFAIL